MPPVGNVVGKSQIRTILLCILSMTLAVSHTASGKEDEQRAFLPPVESNGEISVEEAIRLRRSVREFGRRALALEDVSKVTSGWKLAAPQPASTFIPLREAWGL